MGPLTRFPWEKFCLSFCLPCVHMSTSYVQMEMCIGCDHILVFLTGFECLSLHVLCVLVTAHLWPQLSALTQILPLGFSDPESIVMTKRVILYSSNLLYRKTAKKMGMVTLTLVTPNWNCPESTTWAAPISYNHVVVHPLKGKEEGGHMALPPSWIRWPYGEIRFPSYFGSVW